MTQTLCLDDTGGLSTGGSNVDHNSFHSRSTYCLPGASVDLMLITILHNKYYTSNYRTGKIISKIKEFSPNHATRKWNT